MGPRSDFKGHDSTMAMSDTFDCRTFAGFVLTADAILTAARFADAVSQGWQGNAGVRPGK